MPGVSEAVPRGGGLRVRARRHVGRAAEPRRAAARRGRRPGARLPVARRHRARLARGLVARPVVGRAARRLRVGPRRARHEVADRGRGRGRRRAGARGLAAAARRAEDHLGCRRGGRRAGGRAVADPGAAGPRALRHAAQRGRRAADALRRPPPLRRLLRREGHIPLRRARERPRGPRLGARARRQRAAQAPALRRAARRGGRDARPDRPAARVPVRGRARPGGPGRRARAPARRSTSGWPR